LNLKLTSLGILITLLYNKIWVNKRGDYKSPRAKSISLLVYFRANQ